MNLIKKQTANPWLPSLVDEFFNHDWLPSAPAFHTTVPAVNVKELEKDFVLEIAVPGLRKEDFTIEIDNDLLSISSSFEQKTKKAEGKFTRREFSYNSFRRSFSIPEAVDANKIKANYTDGILTIDLPKRKEALPQPTKRIAIE